MEGSSRAQLRGIRAPPCLWLTPPWPGSAHCSYFGDPWRGGAGRTWGSLQPRPGARVTARVRDACGTLGQGCWLSREAKIRLQQSCGAGEEIRAGRGAQGACLLLRHPPPQLYVPLGHPSKPPLGLGASGQDSSPLSSLPTPKGIIRYHPLGLGFGGTGQGTRLSPATALCPALCPQTPAPCPIPVLPSHPQGWDRRDLQCGEGKAHRVVSRDLASSWRVAQPGDSPTGREVMCQVGGGTRGRVEWEDDAALLVAPKTPSPRDWASGGRQRSPAPWHQPVAIALGKLLVGGRHQKPLTVGSVPRAKRGAGLGRAAGTTAGYPGLPCAVIAPGGGGSHPISKGGLFRCREALEGRGDLDSGLFLPLYGEHRLGQEGTKVSWVLAPEHFA